jgi:hypothetical protein
MSIAEDIDGMIIYQLKLHQTTTEDLLYHISEKLTPKYPDADFTISGIEARLNSLQDQLLVQQIVIHNRAVWGIYGKNTTTPNKIWHIITSLAKLECHIQSIIYTIRKQYPSILPSEIKNAIGILETNKIIAIKHNIASVAIPEQQFITMERVS